MDPRPYTILDNGTCMNMVQNPHKTRIFYILDFLFVSMVTIEIIRGMGPTGCQGSKGE